ncbi:MAG: hypothetical protein SFU87_02855 [Chitinophagaceae bacterium]|nr:hypothetical protein [Chitinophagaceae bacterium]
MKRIYPFIIFLLWFSCKKAPDQPEEIKLDGTWRLKSIRSDADTLNTTAAWMPLKYEKQYFDFDLYCVNDSRAGQSYISMLNCAYDVSPGSSVGVVSSDCARSVFRRDTTWIQLTHYDISLVNDSTVKMLEQYSNSKRINTILAPCNSPQYLPESITKFEATGIWKYDEAGKVITLDFTPGYSRIDGEQVNRFKVIAYSDKEITLRLITSYLAEYLLVKL